MIEACRRDNVALLEEVMNAQTSHLAKADLINNTKDGIGNHCLHIAVSYGSCKSRLYEGMGLDGGLLIS